ncbi:MAG: hypothetical protein JW963_07800 [Anaerolineales bacterium]|nr:hypothetical protein [Anaerolineales bacterium]
MSNSKHNNDVDNMHWFSKIKVWFYSASIGRVQGVIFAFACSVFLLMALLVLIRGEIPLAFTAIFISGFLFILSLIGIAGIARREFYWSRDMTLCGPVAVITGWIFAAFSILVGLYFLIEGIRTL